MLKNINKWMWKLIVYHPGYFYRNILAKNASSEANYVHLRGWYFKFKTCLGKIKR